MAVRARVRARSQCLYTQTPKRWGWLLSWHFPTGFVPYLRFLLALFQCATSNTGLMTHVAVSTWQGAFLAE